MASAMRLGDALAPPFRADVQLCDLGFETGAGVEQDDPAEPDASTVRRARHEDVVVPGELRRRARARGQLIGVSSTGWS